MSIDFGKFGYAYTIELCAAIERYTADKVSQNPNIFIYCDVNLQYAIERQLYISCINSVSLYTFYVSLQHGAKAVNVTPLEAIEVDIAREFPGAGDMELVARFEARSLPGYYLLKWLYKYLRAHFLNNRRLSNKISLTQPPVLFHVVHSKFAIYLKAIVNYLASDQYAYLVTLDTSLVTELESQGEPYVLEERRPGTIHSVFLNRTLQRYDGLIDIVETIYSALNRIKPRCVVVVEGNAPQDIITAEVCSQLAIPIFCIPQGWSSIVHSGFSNMSFDNMFVWGGGFAKLLAPYNPRQCFTVTGSHVIQAISQETPNLQGQSMVISFFLQSPCALLSSNGYEDFIELIIWCAKEYPVVRFVVREHPSYPVPVTLRAKMKAYDNIAFSSPIRDALSEVIRESSLVVSVFSTVLLEAAALGTVPLICSIGSMPHYEPDLEGAAIEVYSVQEAKKEIHQVVYDPSYLDRYKSKLAIVSAQYFSNGNAARTISDKIKTAAGLQCKQDEVI
jgi:hypothetical protein